MSESVQLAIVNQLPMILTALAAVLSALAGIWAAVRSGKAAKAATGAAETAQAAKQDVGTVLVKVDGTLSRVMQAIDKASRAEALSEAALQTATAPQTQRLSRATDRKPDEPGTAPVPATEDKI